VGGSCDLRNYHVREAPSDITLAEAMLATCSTPPFFKPATIERPYVTYSYIGADLRLCNPTIALLLEAHREFDRDLGVACLLSLGTGHPGVIGFSPDINPKEWNEALSRIPLSAHHTQRIDELLGQYPPYYRFSVIQGLQGASLGVWKPSGEISSLTHSYLQKHHTTTKLDKCVEAIKGRKARITLAELRESCCIRLLPTIAGSKWQPIDAFKPLAYCLLFAIFFLVLTIGWKSYKSVIDTYPPPLPALAGSFVVRQAPTEFMETAMFKNQENNTNQRMIVVTGVGGCGKTQLVRYIAGKHKARCALFTSRD